MTAKTTTAKKPEANQAVLNVHYAIIQCGYISETRYPYTVAGRRVALAEIDRANSAANDECDDDVCGDGAASLVVVDDTGEVIE